ncbi:porin family protein [Flavobacteriales bacterium]|nr:porin family protein [Flavobacteriales bacterium]
MKKIFFLIIFICSINFSSLSQEFNAGISAGISTSQISGDNLAGFNKAGIILGGFVNRKINNLLMVQMEIIYIQKGSSNPNQNINNLADIHLDYIEIPLLAIIKNSEKLSFEGGVHCSALIDGYYKDLYGELENQTSFDSFELGAIIGISYNLSSKISLNTRLSNSIIPIAEHASGQTYKFNKGKYNTGLNFILKYQI